LNFCSFSSKAVYTNNIHFVWKPPNQNLKKISNFKLLDQMLVLV
jgi:hypothetical protein